MIYRNKFTVGDIVAYSYCGQEHPYKVVKTTPQTICLAPMNVSRHGLSFTTVDGYVSRVVENDSEDLTQTKTLRMRKDGRFGMNTEHMDDLTIYKLKDQNGRYRILCNS